jgi:hypothetical protein
MARSTEDMVEFPDGVGDVGVKENAEEVADRNHLLEKEGRLVGEGEMATPTKANTEADGGNLGAESSMTETGVDG